MEAWCNPERAEKMRKHAQSWRSSSEGQRYFKQKRKEQWQDEKTYYQEKNRRWYSTDEAKRKREQYRKENAALLNYHTAKRHAQKLEATPPWLTDEQKAQIKEIYRKSRQLQDETGVAHNVDHIHPLQGKTVCGLHVPWNLQILTEAENCAKSNTLIY